MAWESVEWACGHTGSMQLYGKISGREARVAYEAGRKCFACWLVDQWESKGDPRALKPNRYILAKKIAEGKGIRIEGLPEDVPPVVEDNPLAKYSLEELQAEITRRQG